MDTSYCGEPSDQDIGYHPVCKMHSSLLQIPILSWDQLKSRLSFQSGSTYGLLLEYSFSVGFS
jgi:hypothetical protein